MFKLVVQVTINRTFVLYLPASIFIQSIFHNILIHKLTAKSLPVEIEFTEYVELSTKAAQK